MDLQLRCIASHPRATSSSSSIEFDFSSQSPRLVTASGDLLIDQSTSTNALRATIRTSAPVEKVIYVGGSKTFLVFMENGNVCSYIEKLSSLARVQERPIGGDGRSVTLAEGSRFGSFGLFCKSESPSLWCLPVTQDGTMGDPFKLRSDIEGDQDNVNFVGGLFAKARGKVATKPKSRVCPITALATHPTMSLVSAAYINGIIRVWDAGKKEQRSHFDAQLMLGEKIVDIAMHPSSPLVAACTTHGRIMTFYVKNVPFKHGDDPVLATSKTRDRKRRFRALCFMPGSPNYLYLLTAKRRILVRMVDDRSLLVHSTRFSKASKPLAVESTSLITSTRSTGLSDTAKTINKRRWKLFCEPAFGLIAASIDVSADVFVFQTRTQGLPGIRRPISPGLDTGFSTERGDVLQGPVTVPSESLIAYRGVLFSYRLGSEELTALCKLPPGDATRVEVARDEHGKCQAALVFYHGDEEVNQTLGFTESEEITKYTLCTRRGEGEPWNSSEPGDGVSGCFLNYPGQHDQIVILANSGTTLSLLSFSGGHGKDGKTRARPGRGVVRIKLENKKISSVFRSPFAGWTAVLYHDVIGKKLCVSKNAFERSDRSSGARVAPGFQVDDVTALSLLDSEVVIDVRWQQLPFGTRDERYLGAIMTDRRILFVRDVLDLVSVFEFRRVDRMVVPFSPPSFSWTGSSVLVLFGNSLISVTTDGRCDLIAGVSHGQNVTTLVATLPDRIIYARPSPQNANDSLSIASRPYSALSGLLRGVFEMDRSRSAETVEQVRRLVESHDVSQGSMEMMKTLIGHDLSAIAYLLAQSDQGKLSLSAMRRAAFLGRLGDIRGALAIAETEYRNLANSESFHSGTALYRLLQRMFNSSLASGDFAAARRCAELLGKKGTLGAFVDVEGGDAAIRRMYEQMRGNGPREVLEKMETVIEMSGRSSVATDWSMVPSQRQIGTVERAMRMMRGGGIAVGTEDVGRKVLVIQEDGDEGATKEVELDMAKAGDIIGRLEMVSRKTGFTVEGEEEVDWGEAGEDIELGIAVAGGDDRQVVVVGGIEEREEDDEEDLFETGRRDTGNVVEKVADELEERIHEMKEESAEGVAEGMNETKALVVGTREMGGEMVMRRAVDKMERGIEKMEQGEWESGQKTFEGGLKILRKGHEKEERVDMGLMGVLAQYRMACMIHRAVEELLQSNARHSAAGKMTYLQLGIGMMRLIGLKTKDAVRAMIVTVEACLNVGNFGMAAKVMKHIKNTCGNQEMDQQVRIGLRDRYNICASRQFMDSVVVSTNIFLCSQSLQVISNNNALICGICQSVFAYGQVSLGQRCHVCGVGRVSTFQTVHFKQFVL